MNARVLDPAEWEKLGGKGIDGMLPLIDPENARVIVVEEDGEIVAHLGVLRVTHLESLWVHPKYRADWSVWLKLRRLIGETVKPWAKRWVMAQVADERVCDIVKRLGGVKIEADSYAMTFGGTNG